MAETFEQKKQRIKKFFEETKDYISDIGDVLLINKNDTNTVVPNYLNNSNPWGGGTTHPDFPSPTLPPYPEPNETTVTNTVYKQPVTIYESNTFITNNISSELPTKPSSLLPVKDEPEEDGQTPTKISIGAPISLATSIKNQKFGQMLFNPFSTEKLEIRQIQDVNLGKKLEELNDIGIDRFAGYLAGEEKHNALDAIALFTPTAMRGLSGKLGVIFGYDTLKYLFANYTASSLNAFIGVSDLIPKEYEIVNYNPEYTPIANDLNNIRLANTGEGGGIDLGDIVDVPINWEDWVKEAVTNEYGADGLSKLPVKIDNLPDLIRHAIAPFFYRLGLGELPFILPKTLTEDPKNGEVEEQVTANKLSEFLLWQIGAFDSVLGQFPIKIRIQDSDLIKTGDQELRLEFPNLAETLAELATLALSNQTNNDALLKMGLIELAEVGQTKQVAIQNQYLSAAIQEYLGFKSKQVKKDVQFLFNPGILAEEEEKQTLENALKPAILPVQIEENDDEDTLETQVYQLIEAARIIKAVHWRTIDLKGNPGGQIADIIKRASKLKDDLKSDKEEDIEEFLKDIENGFTGKIPGKDPNKPYNRSYSQRPKVKRFTTDDNNP